MTQIKVNNFVHENIDESIIVTGLPRSGTTILGKLIGSFDSVEYGFEPPLIAYLDAKCRHGQMESETAYELLEVYLYYDYFAEYLHGRGYNYRPGDASNALGMQTVPEVLEKWNQVSTMADAVEIASEYTFSFKSPGVYHALSAFYEHASEGVRIIDIGRNLDRVLASLVEKRWFFDENLGSNATGMWPFHDTGGQYMVPYFVEAGDVDAWQSMSPETRSTYVCNRIAEDRLSFQEQYGDDETYHTLRYEWLIEQPDAVADELAGKLGVEWGYKTKSVVNEIEPTSSPRDVDTILEACDDAVCERFRNLRAEFSY